MAVYEQIENNARIFLSTVFKGIDKDKKFKGDIWAEDGVKFKDSKGGEESTNIEVKYTSSPGPSMELDTGENIVEIKFKENSDVEIESARVFRSNINDKSKEAEILRILNGILEEYTNPNNTKDYLDLCKKIKELNNSYRENETARLNLNIISEENFKDNSLGNYKADLLNLLYDREGFNEKVFCCVNKNKFMSIIPRSSVIKYYNLIPKLEIKKGYNDLKADDRKKYSKSIVNSIKKSGSIGEFIADHVINSSTVIEKYGKSSSTRLCIHTDINLRDNPLMNIDLKNFVFETNGGEKLMITPPNGYETVKEGSEYRYKIIRKSGVFRFKFMLGINKKLDIQEGKNEHYIDHSNVNINIKDEYRNKWDEIKKIELLSFKNEEELLDKLNNIIGSSEDQWEQEKSKSQKEPEEPMKVKRESLDSSLKRLNEDYNKEDNKYELFINDLYDLRQNSLNNEGEYGIGNLIFKKFRDLGYLDNLKELSRSLKVTELSEDKKED